MSVLFSFDVSPDDSDVLSYFPPTTSTSYPQPPASAAGSHLIIHSLLEAAGIDSSLYPPKSWTELPALLQAIDTSRFDTLRRNGLIFYLLLDYHLLPSLQNSLPESAPSETPRMAEQFSINRLLPTFWKDSIEKGFWRLDKGYFPDAIPWLNAQNSGLYADLVVARLNPIALAPEEALKRSECLVRYLHLAKPLLEPRTPLETLQIIAIALAAAEGLDSCMRLVRSRQVRLELLLLGIWSWLFSFADQRVQSRLIKSVVSLPLTKVEVDSVAAFALGEGTTTSSRARALALDTVIIRLLNGGQVAEALRLNGLADQRQDLYADSSELDPEASIRRKRKRREMIRLAQQMLPEAVRPQLLSGPKEESRPTAGTAHDEDFDLEIIEKPQNNVSIPEQTRGYLQCQSVSSSDKGPTSLARLASPLAAQRRALTSRSPFASASNSPSTNAGANVGSPLAAKQQHLNHLQGSPASREGSPLAKASSSQGPYARLAAQIMSNHLRASQDADGDESISTQLDHLAHPEVNFDSLLPQKRSVSTRKHLERTSTDVDDGNAAEPSSLDEPSSSRMRVLSEAKSTPAGGFELPKRRYTKKISPPADSPAKARRSAAAALSQGSKTGTAPGGESTPASKSKRAAAADTPATASKSTTRRSTRGQSVPGGFPGQQDEETDRGEATDHGTGADEDEAPPEMVEVARPLSSARIPAKSSSIPTTKATPRSKRSTASVTDAAPTSTRSQRASSVRPLTVVDSPSTSTPRRSSRRTPARDRDARASSILSTSVYGDDDDNDDDNNDDGEGQGRGAADATPSTSTRSRRRTAATTPKVASSSSAVPSRTTRSRSILSTGTAADDDRDDDDDVDGEEQDDAGPRRRRGGATGASARSSASPVKSKGRKAK